MEDNTSSILYVKDKFAISDTSYHELSMISDLPLKQQLDINYDIKSALRDIRDIKRVRQSLKSRLLPRLTYIVDTTPTDI